jgi:DNA-binding HxlR family transcriptional regulator
MNAVHRSGCPINLTLEVVGDKWSLLIMRDMIFAGKRHFRELLQSDEGISSNILTDRLNMLVEVGLLTRAPDPGHRQKVLYSLTEPSIALVPVLVQIGIWGRNWLPASEELGAISRDLEAGGPASWAQLMADLRATHLGASGTNS